MAAVASAEAVTAVEAADIVNRSLLASPVIFTETESGSMRQTKLNSFTWPNLPLLAALAILWAACFPLHSLAQQSGQKLFSAPEEAATALVTAAQSNNEGELLKLFGPDGQRIISSGDPAKDAESRANFVRKYNEMHRFVHEPDGTAILYIGAENWPTPIPLVHKGNSWYFDTEAGEQEIIYRRIGRNEISAIRICTELVAAENEYHSAHGKYARKISSDDGQQDSLYWKASGTGPQSPIGPLVAAAFAPGNAEGPDSGQAPYRGYFYRILSAQGKHASGGAKSYIADDKMTGGFAFVAYPAEYRSSGVMTFIVNQDGIVYEKDLGNKTSELAEAMKAFNPGPGWKKAEIPQQETAAKQ